MKTFEDLKVAVKRFVYNNTNAQDAFQGDQSGADLESLLDEAILTAANNARKYVESNANFTALEVTVPAFFPKNMAINLNRLYSTDEDFDVSSEVAATTKYRFDGNGILYIAIPNNLAGFWGTANKDELKSFVISTGTGQAEIPEVPFGEYTVWDALGVINISGTLYQFYRIGWRVASIVRPTAWTDCYNRVGPGYFSSYFRLNAFNALTYMSNGAPVCPIEVDTRQGEHIRISNQINKGTWDSRESAVQGGTIRGLLVGRKLQLNQINTDIIHVEISGSRWMREYTKSDDTDFILEDGFAFMQWQTILELNHIVQIYVPRAEGSLPPPEKARNEAWASLMVNDAFANTSFFHQ